MASSRKTCGALSANGKKLVEGIMTMRIYVLKRMMFYKKNYLFFLKVCSDVKENCKSPK